MANCKFKDFRLLHLIFFWSKAINIGRKFARIAKSTNEDISSGSLGGKYFEWGYSKGTLYSTQKTFRNSQNKTIRVTTRKLPKLLISKEIFIALQYSIRRPVRSISEDWRKRYVETSLDLKSVFTFVTWVGFFKVFWEMTCFHKRMNLARIFYWKISSKGRKVSKALFDL